MALVRGENLGKWYRAAGRDVTVFAGLSFEVAVGERVALTGESGAGKSTLLHLLGGLDHPSEGKVLLNHQDLSSLSADKLSEVRNRDIGFVWQYNTLLPEFSALENVMMPLLVRGMTRAEAAPLARRRLQEVGLGERLENRGGELSGGEQQRAVLARALVGNPKLLLADEPTGNLDGRTGTMIMHLLEEVHEANGLTTVYVTHHPDFAKRAQRVLKLEAGVLLAAGLGQTGMGAQQ